MENIKPTIYEEIRSAGISRKDFLKFCITSAAMLGLEASGVAQIVKALETKPRPPVIWFHFQECTCCSESFIRGSNPSVASLILEKMSLDYSETLMAASGFQAEEAYHTVMKNNPGEYIVLVEGSVATANEAYCCIGGRSSMEIMKEAASNAKAIICWGNCACAGCIQAAKPNPTGAKPIYKVIKGKPIVNVQGCPPIPNVMLGVIVHILAFDRVPEVDAMLRPKAFYSRRVHDTCYRRPNFDAGLFVNSFDDFGAKHGYCLYKMGCRGPVTYNDCGTMRWNDGISFPIQSGHGCIGCAADEFWDHGPFYQHLASFPGFGIESTADKVGLGFGIAAAAGIAGHAILTNFRKKREITNTADETTDTKPNKEK